MVGRSLAKGLFALSLVLTLLLPDVPVRGQEAGYRPGLLYREDWRESPAETPVSQAHVQHPELILNLHGPGRDSLKKSHHDEPVDDPYYVWSGLCTGTWGLSLRYPHGLLDLSGYGKIRLRSRQSGLRVLHLMLELGDGRWVVSREGVPASGDWVVTEFPVPELHWYHIDLQSLLEGAPVPDPDLSRIRSVGCTDLMRGGGSAASSRLDWIEIYAFSGL
ncbi:MAG: hypothetical protein R2751_13490 [Bacteroidales bacterium]